MRMSDTVRTPAVGAANVVILHQRSTGRDLVNDLGLLTLISLKGRDRLHLFLQTGLGTPAQSASSRHPILAGGQ